MKHPPRFELEEPALLPAPLAPPGRGIPRLPEPLPVMPNQRAELHDLVQDAIETKLPKDDLDVVCYLIRRAYGMGTRR